MRVRRPGGELLARRRHGDLRAVGRRGADQRRARLGVREDDVADHFVVIGGRLLVADRGGEVPDFDLGGLGDLDQRAAGLGEFAEEHPGEHRILLLLADEETVQRLLLGARRHQYEYAFGRVDARQASGASDGARPGRSERIVSARVQNENRHARALDHALHRDGRVADPFDLIGLDGRRVDGQQVVRAGNLEAVAGKKNSAQSPGCTEASNAARARLIASRSTFSARRTTKPIFSNWSPTARASSTAVFSFATST
jgi:hypothetical protein